MRRLAILLTLVALGVLAWMTLREGGWLGQVTEARVEAALTANGVPVEMAQCMAPRLTDQLTISQLTKLERLSPQDGEARIPASAMEALKRLERVDDPEAVRVLAATGTACGVSSLLDRLR
ncbi:MAG: hypothetical protein AAF127_15615 [Pseudomonadota bacterium]